MNRRTFVKRSAAAGLVLTVPRWLDPLLAPAADAVPFTQPLRFPPVLTDAELTVPVVAADVPIMAGTPTRMWTFGGSFPGPTIRRPSGATTKVTFDHQLPAAGTLTVHHHGHHSASKDDGQPMGEDIQPGAQRTYTYAHVEDGKPLRGAMRWYHDHTHGRTGLHSWHGLVGLFVVDDPVEATLGLPGVERELLLVISETTLDDNNQLTDPFTNAPNPGGDNVGLGKTVLVNGVPMPYVEVEPTRYRLRVLNAASFHPYNLGFANGAKLTQIGNESGLFPVPIDRDRVLLGPAERCDVIVDFSSLAGQDVVLDSVGQATRPVLPPAAASDAVVMQFRVRGTVVPSTPPKSTLVPLPAWVAGLPAQPDQPDRILAFGQGIDPAAPTSTNLTWTINGKPYDPASPVASPALGSTETWLLVNATTQSHYIHLHDVDWKLIQRNGMAPDPWEDVLKETFRLDPGDVLLVGTKFTDHLGTYMVHCHMLSHEDHAMMAPFEVVAAGASDKPSDPFTALTAAEAERVRTMLAAQKATPGRPAAVPRAPLLLERGSTALCDLGQVKKL